METIKQNKKNIKEIITALENGAVLVCPTDTVYGLIADTTNETAVKKIYEIKKRLIDEKDLTDEEFNRIDTPIGIKFAAETPQEIALSILAKLIDVKNSK